MNEKFIFIIKVIVAHEAKLKKQNELPFKKLLTLLSICMSKVNKQFWLDLIKFVKMQEKLMKF